MSQYVHSDINTDYFTDNKASGGTGGQLFKFVKEKTGAVMKSIEGWKEDWRIRGVRVRMTDGSSYLAGVESGSHSLFELAADEMITRLNIQPSGESSGSGTYRLGAIWMQTNKGRDWGIFSDNLEEGTQYWVPVGSGLCCGLFGKEELDVDRLGMAMLRSVTSATLDDVEYPNLDLQVVASTPTFLVTEDYDNTGGSLEQEFTLRMTETVTVITSWRTSTIFGFGESVLVKAGIPMVADVESNWEWSISEESTHQMDKVETKTMEYEWQVRVPPHTKVKAEGRVFADELDTPFTGTMNLILENGVTYSYHTEGMYTGANYTRVELVITEYDSTGSQAATARKKVERGGCAKKSGKPEKSKA